MNKYCIKSSKSDADIYIAKFARSTSSQSEVPPVFTYRYKPVLQDTVEWACLGQMLQEQILLRAKPLYASEASFFSEETYFLILYMATERQYNL